MTRQRIFYLCPEFDEPAGGLKVIYKHVDLLNSNNITSYVVHKTPGYRCSWFENSTEIMPLSTMRPDESDIIVVPAIWGAIVDSFFPGIWKVIFNQGCYLTFQGYPIGKEVPPVPYRHGDVVATMVVSDDSKEYLEYAFPGIHVHKVRNSIDTEQFAYSDKKENLLAFMVRKRYQDVEQVINILKYRGMLDDYDLAPITGASESDVAGIMGKARVFMYFCDGEGWGLPVAEAMSCGCIVVGNHGYGGKELHRPGYSFSVEQGDILSFVAQVEEVLKACENDPDRINVMALQASEYIRSNYSSGHTGEDLMHFFENLGGTVR